MNDERAGRPRVVSPDGWSRRWLRCGALLVLLSLWIPEYGFLWLWSPHPDWYGAVGLVALPLVALALLLARRRQSAAWLFPTATVLGLVVHVGPPLVAVGPIPRFLAGAVMKLAVVALATGNHLRKRHSSMTPRILLFAGAVGLLGYVGYHAVRNTRGDFWALEDFVQLGVGTAWAFAGIHSGFGGSPALASALARIWLIATLDAPWVAWKPHPYVPPHLPWDLLHVGLVPITGAALAAWLDVRLMVAGGARTARVFE